MSNVETLLRELVREEIRAVLGNVGGAVYSTATRDTWPPGSRSRRSARERIRAVPGHERDGDGRATVWRVSVEAYRKHHIKRVTIVHHSPVRTDEELADAALAASGLRATRRAS